MDCELCFEAFDDAARRPKVLPCGHSACLCCLKQLSSHRCPSCRKGFRGPPDQLADNYSLMKAWKKKPDWWCTVCADMASTHCQENHAIIKPRVALRERVDTLLVQLPLVWEGVRVSLELVKGSDPDGDDDAYLDGLLRLLGGDVRCDLTLTPRQDSDSARTYSTSWQGLSKQGGDVEDLALQMISFIIARRMLRKLDSETDESDESAAQPAAASSRAIVPKPNLKSKPRPAVPAKTKTDVSSSSDDSSSSDAGPPPSRRLAPLPPAVKTTQPILISSESSESSSTESEGAPPTVPKPVLNKPRVSVTRGRCLTSEDDSSEDSSDEDRPIKRICTSKERPKNGQDPPSEQKPSAAGAAKEPVQKQQQPTTTPPATAVQAPTTGLATQGQQPTNTSPPSSAGQALTTSLAPATILTMMDLLARISLPSMQGQRLGQVLLASKVSSHGKPQPPSGQMPQPPPGQMPQPRPGQMPQPPPGQMPQPPPGQMPQPPPGQMPQPPPGQMPQPPPGQMGQTPPGQMPQPRPGQMPQPPPGQMPQPPPGQMPRAREVPTPLQVPQPIKTEPTVKLEVPGQMPRRSDVQPLAGPPRGQMQPPAGPPRGQMQPPAGPPPGQMQPPAGPPPGQMQPPAGPPRGQMQPPAGPPPGQMQPPAGPPPGQMQPPAGPPRGQMQPPACPPPGQMQPPACPLPGQMQPPAGPPPGQMQPPGTLPVASQALQAADPQPAEPQQQPAEGAVPVRVAMIDSYDASQIVADNILMRDSLIERLGRQGVRRLTKWCSMGSDWFLKLLQSLAPTLEELRASAVHGDHLRFMLDMPRLRRLEVRGSTLQFQMGDVDLSSWELDPLHHRDGLRWLRVERMPPQVTATLVRAHAATLEVLVLVTGTSPATWTPPFAHLEPHALLEGCGLRALRLLLLVRGYDAGQSHNSSKCLEQKRALRRVLPTSTEVECSACHWLVPEAHF